MVIPVLDELINLLIGISLETPYEYGTEKKGPQTETDCAWVPPKR